MSHPRCEFMLDAQAQLRSLPEADRETELDVWLTQCSDAQLQELHSDLGFHDIDELGAMIYYAAETELLARSVEQAAQEFARTGEHPPRFAPPRVPTLDQIEDYELWAGRSRPGSAMQRMAIAQVQMLTAMRAAHIGSGAAHCLPSAPRKVAVSADSDGRLSVLKS